MAPSHTVPRPGFLFNHFPKAGGTSFFAVLKQNIAEAAISPQLMEQEVRLARPERFEHFRLIRGHFSVLTQMGFDRGRYSMTLVREPVSTILSTYNFWRGRSEEDAVSAQAKRIDFPQFVRRFADSPTIIRNPYTHHFAGVSRDYPGEPADQELLLQYARHNLAHFNFVGICERFEESIRLLCRELGWQAPAAMPHENRSLGQQERAAIDAATMQLLLERNQLDLQLYDYAKALLAERRARVGQACAAGVANRFVQFPIPPDCPREASVVGVSARAAGGMAPGLEIRLTCRTRALIPELVAGIMVLSADGDVVYGSNTWLENVRLAHAAGDDFQISFELECGLAPGLYSVTAALSHAQRPGFHYDWVDRAAIFEAGRPTASSTRLKRLRVEKIHSGAESVSSR